MKPHPCNRHSYLKQHTCNGKSLLPQNDLIPWRSTRATAFRVWINTLAMQNPYAKNGPISTNTFTWKIFQFWHVKKMKNPMSFPEFCSVLVGYPWQFCLKNGSIFNDKWEHILISARFWQYSMKHGEFPPFFLLIRYLLLFDRLPPSSFAWKMRHCLLKIAKTPIFSSDFCSVMPGYLLPIFRVKNDQIAEDLKEKKQMFSPGFCSILQGYPLAEKCPKVQWKT